MLVYSYKDEKEHKELLKKLTEMGKTVIDMRQQ